jgi:hypothetical protein
MDDGALLSELGREPGIFIINFTHFTASSPMIVITVEEKGPVFGLNSAARYLMGETFELDTFGFNA